MFIRAIVWYISLKLRNQTFLSLFKANKLIKLVLLSKQNLISQLISDIRLPTSVSDPLFFHADPDPGKHLHADPDPEGK